MSEVRRAARIHRIIAGGRGFTFGTELFHHAVAAILLHSSHWHCCGPQRCIGRSMRCPLAPVSQLRVRRRSSALQNYTQKRSASFTASYPGRRPNADCRNRPIRT